MIWHIFKKDWKLLWVYVVAVAAMHFATAIALYELARTASPATSVWAAFVDAIPTLAYLGMTFVTAMVVLQDGLVGVRQDWLVRPIRRMDLLLAKLLFIILLVQGPMFVADVIGGLANGFPLSQCFVAALSRSVFVFLAYNLWAFAVASLIRNLSDAVVAATLITVAGIGFNIMAQTIVGRGIDPTQSTGVEWVAISLRLIISLVASAIVLLVQFTKRKTIPLRAFAVAALFLALLTRLLPWHTAFAAEQHMFPGNGMGSLLAIAFDPSHGRFQREQGAADLNELSASENRETSNSNDAVLYLPITLTHLPANSIFKADRAEYTISSVNGKPLFRGNGSLLVSTGDAPELTITQYQTIRIPVGLYSAMKGQDVSLAIRYSATSFGLDNSFTIPAVGGEERMPGFGVCTTRIDSDGDGIVLRCLQIGNPPTCVAVFLEHTPSGKRNPQQRSCPGDYAPYFGRLFYDSLARFGTELDFRDLNGLAHYPVDGSMLHDARVVIRNYMPQAHFTLNVAIPSIRLGDWQPR